MLEQNDLIKIGELMTNALEEQDIRFEQKLDERFLNFEKNMDDKLDQKLEPIILRINAIQGQLLLISQRLDSLEAKLDRHIQGNNEDLNFIIKDLEVQKKNIAVLEEKIRQIEVARG